MITGFSIRCLLVLLWGLIVTDAFRMGPVPFQSINKARALTTTPFLQRSSLHEFRSSAAHLKSTPSESNVGEQNSASSSQASVINCHQQSAVVQEKVSSSQMIRQYGVAYLVTSITLSLITFSASYVLVANGIDMISLLKKYGIEASPTAANVGTLGVAYAIHKAISPFRFPPTVALTPFVAKLLKKKSPSSDSPPTK